MEFELVSLPDEAVKQSAEERHARLTKPRGSLGRLEELGAWLAACQGVCPPRPLGRPRVVVFAGDHGVAANGVSAYPSEVTAQMVANFQAGGAAINVLAGIAGATVRVVDMSVAVGTAADGHKVRQSSGSIDREDALSDDEVEAALAAGKAIADEEVDAGADLLVAGDMGIGNTTPAAVLIAAITGSEPVAVVGRGTGIDDQTWMRKTAAIRDALRRAKPVTADPVALLRTTAGADITAMAAFLAQAAVRRTPVVLDGVVSGAAALLAEELAPGARAWWVAGHRSTEPAHTLVLEQLDLKPLLEMNMRLGEGSGATAAIPLLTMAVQVLNDMATFEDAGVSGPDEDDEPDTETTAESDTGPATGTTTGPATETATQTTAGSATETTTGSAAEAATGSAAESDSGPRTQTTTGPTTQTAAGSATETAAGPTTQTSTGPDAKPDIGSATGATAQTNTGSTNQTTAGPATETTGGPTIEAATGSAAGPATDESDTGPATETTGATTQTTTGPDAKPDTGAATQTTGSATEAAAGPPAGPTTQTTTGAATDTAAGAATQNAAGTGAEDGGGAAREEAAGTE
jgi:nicotinate-nucleotide--dimethylbenzimidazole phosphoribosyltransferase